jgi:hypothetical protein
MTMVVEIKGIYFISQKYSIVNWNAKNEFLQSFFRSVIYLSKKILEIIGIYFFCCEEVII